MNINNLVFFDKNGESYNFNQSTSGYWEGADYFLPISTSLFDCSNLIILENTAGVYSFPKMEEGSKIEAIWTTSESADNFFLFTISREGIGSDSVDYIVKQQSITVKYSDFDQQSGALDLAYPLQVNVSFAPIVEKAYSRVLQLYYSVPAPTLDNPSNMNTTLFLELSFYGEGEDEDERFRVWLENFGIRFNREDALILKDYDLKEGLPDWKQLNAARKQLLVNRDQVYPYVGTYKGMLNMVSLLGYRDVLRVKEYWKNNNIYDTANYGRLSMVDVTDLMQLGDISLVNLVDENGAIKRGKTFKKTEFLALVYEFTVATDVYDDDGLPIIESTTEFTVDEIFFKLRGVSKKLRNEILPVNVVIRDIIGEFIYFQKLNLRNWYDETLIGALQINDTYKIKV